MAHELLVQQNQLVHTGFFTRPLFELWGEGKTILRGLYEALSPYGAALPDMHLQPVQTTPGDPAISVSIGARGTFTFRLDRTESTFFNFSEELLGDISRIIESSAQWIRVAVPSFEFKSHQAVYSSHSIVEKSTVEAVLASLGAKTLKSGGTDRGTGVIFHWSVPEENWTSQLVLDRSVIVSGGLYLMFSLLIAGDISDYVAFHKKVRSYLGALLTELGLAFAGPSS